MAEDTTDTTTDEEVVEQADNPDAVKKALAAERARAKEAEKAARKATEEREAMQAELAKFREGAMSEQEKAIEEARREAAEAARNEVLTEVRGKRLAVEIKAAATGKFADPDDAVAFLTTADLDPDDTAAIGEAIEELLMKKPHLKAGATQANGHIDQGTRDSDAVRQLSRDDLRGMKPEQIAEARAKGQLRDLMSTGK